MPYPRELVTAANQIIILSIINKSDTYGYEIIQKVAAVGDNNLHIKEGTLYPLLIKMRAKGHIKGRWKTAPSGHRRKYYSINQAGKSHLYKIKKQWGQMNKLILGL